MNDEPAPTTRLDPLVMRFRVVLYQRLKGKDECRGYFKLFEMSVPPQVGFQVQEHEWRTEGAMVESVHVNRHGVCFLWIQDIEGIESWNEWEADYKDWIREYSDVDVWEMTLGEIESA